MELSNLQTLTLQRDVELDKLKSKVEIHELKNDLREMGALYDFEKFMIDAAVVVAGICSCIVFLGSKFFDGVDKFLKWMDGLGK